MKECPECQNNVNYVTQNDDWERCSCRTCGGYRGINLKEVSDFAKQKHGNQKRKYTNEPYIVHPMSVAQTLLDLNAPEEVVAAAILHDTIEDTDTTYEEIKEKFGEIVASLVLEVTDVSKPEDGNRSARKHKDILHLAKSSYWGASIKLADLIDNSRSIVKYDKEFSRQYLIEKRFTLNVLSQGHPILKKWARDILELSHQIIGKS